MTDTHNPEAPAGGDVAELQEVIAAAIMACGAMEDEEGLKPIQRAGFKQLTEWLRESAPVLDSVVASLASANEQVARLRGENENLRKKWALAVDRELTIQAQLATLAVSAQVVMKRLGDICADGKSMQDFLDAGALKELAVALAARPATQTTEAAALAAARTADTEQKAG